MPAHVGAGVPANINKHRGLSPRSYDVALGRCNHLYSVAAITNGAGAVVERYRYDTYGQRTVLAADGVTTRTASSYNQQVGFTGRYLDKEIDLWYFRSRYLSSNIGRFIGRDEMTYVDGRNMYRAYFIPNATDAHGFRSAWGETRPNRSTPQCTPCKEQGHDKKNCYERSAMTVNPVPDVLNIFTYTVPSGQWRRCARTEENIKRTQEHEEFHVKQAKDIAADVEKKHQNHFQDLASCEKVSQAMVKSFDDQWIAAPEPDMPSKSKAQEARESEAANLCADFTPPNRGNR